MKSTIKRPIKRSFIAGCVIFILVICLMLAAVSFSGYRQTLFNQYENYVSNLLNYTASHIEVNDLEECIQTGQKSIRFNKLQSFLDDVKEHTNIEFIYIVIPKNADETDNMESIVAGLSKHEYENEKDKIVEFKSSTGDYYSSETAQKYLDAYRS